MNIIDIIFGPFFNMLFKFVAMPIVGAIAAPLITSLIPQLLGAGGAAAGGAAAGVAAGAGGAAGGGILKGVGANIFQTALGGLQALTGAAKKGQAQKQLPGLEDPEMRAFLNDIQRKRKQLRTGVGLEPVARELRAQQAGTQRAILRRSGGAGGAAIAGLAKAQRATQGAFTEAASRATQQENFLTQVAGQTISDIAQRRLELTLLQRSQGLAESAQLKSEGLSNVLAGVAGQIPLGGGSTKTKIPTTTG